mmetsp:Transcript_119852/g.325200  ORF Transcript_119852/g.325200 Transcript_119852/m.325200 type:complete len:209 (-) Transcript_119852:376-1002(-)
MRKGRGAPCWSFRPSQPPGSTLEPVAKASTLDRVSWLCRSSQLKNHAATCLGPSTLAWARHSATLSSATPHTSMRSCSASRLLRCRCSCDTTSWKPMTRQPSSVRMGPMRKSSHRSCKYSLLFSSDTGVPLPPGLSSRRPSADSNVRGSMVHSRSSACRTSTPPGRRSGRTRWLQKSGSSCRTSPGRSFVPRRHLKTSSESGMGHGQR